MKLFHICIISFLIGLSPITAQTFYGFQTVGKNTFFLSLTWQGEPQVGFGYNNRGFGGAFQTFTDLQAEVRFPLADLYDLNNMKVITGLYKPFTFSRNFMAGGLHVRWERDEDEGEKSSKVSLAATVLPTLYYGSTQVTDKAFGTAALRITYAPVLFGKKGTETAAFSDHKLEVGGHLDMHIERSLSIGLDGYVSKTFRGKNSPFQDEEDTAVEGNMYIGVNYSLYRL